MPSHVGKASHIKCYSWIKYALIGHACRTGERRLLCDAQRLSRVSWVQQTVCALCMRSRSVWIVDFCVTGVILDATLTLYEKWTKADVIAERPLCMCTSRLWCVTVNHMAGAESLANNKVEAESNDLTKRGNCNSTVLKSQTPTRKWSSANMSPARWD